MFYSYIVLLIYVNKTIYLLGNLLFFKIHVNHFMTWDDSPGANVISKCTLWLRGMLPLWVLRHLLSIINSLVVTYNIQLKTNRGALVLPPSDVYVRSFLYLFYPLIKLYYTKALSDQALSLAPDWILLLQRPRIPVSRGSATIFQSNTYPYMTTGKIIALTIQIFVSKVMIWSLPTWNSGIVWECGEK